MATTKGNEENVTFSRAHDTKKQIIAVPSLSLFNNTFTTNQTVMNAFKNTFTVFTFLVLSTVQFFGYSPDTGSWILKVKDSHYLTVDHVDTYAQYIEFAINNRLTTSERSSIQQEIIAQFEEDPYQVTAEARGLEDMLKMLPHLSSSEKKHIRRNILETIAEFATDESSNAFVQIAQKYNAIP